MTGACAGCQLASMTVLGVRMKLIEKLGFPVKVVPV
jgi:NifU-like protein